jgi:hypothetical protein
MAWLQSVVQVGPVAIAVIAAGGALFWGRQVVEAKNAELAAKDAELKAKDGELKAKDGELKAKIAELAAFSSSHLLAEFHAFKELTITLQQERALIQQEQRALIQQELDSRLIQVATSDEQLIEYDEPVRERGELPSGS